MLLVCCPSIPSQKAQFQFWIFFCLGNNIEKSYHSLHSNKKRHRLSCKHVSHLPSINPQNLVLLSGIFFPYPFLFATKTILNRRILHTIIKHILIYSYIPRNYNKLLNQLGWKARPILIFHCEPWWNLIRTHFISHLFLQDPCPDFHSRPQKFLSLLYYYLFLFFFYYSSSFCHGSCSKVKIIERYSFGCCFTVQILHSKPYARGSGQPFPAHIRIWSYSSQQLQFPLQSHKVHNRLSARSVYPGRQELWGVLWQ